MSDERRGPGRAATAAPTGETARSPLSGSWASKAAAQAALPAGLVDLHRRILGGFLATGTAPRGADLAAWAAELDLAEDAVAALAAADLVHTDPTTAAVTTAYPFSGVPTRHIVELDGTPPVYAMCAVDAVGIPLMAGRDGAVISTDPGGGDAIRVERRDGCWLWQPYSTVVLVAATGGPGPSECCTCPLINFHASSESAEAYLRGQREATGRIFSQTETVELARAEFAPLLGNGPDEG